MRKDTHFWVAAAGVAFLACGRQREPKLASSEASGERPALEAKDEHGRNAKGELKEIAEDSHRTEPKAGAEGSGGGASKGKTDDSGGDERQEGTVHEPPSTLPGTAQTDQGTASRRLKEICEKLTQRASQKCTKQVSDMYQSSCSHYVTSPGPCDEQLRLSLECQFQATDESLCAHEVSHHCSQLNRELRTCQRGAAPADQLAPEDDHTLPSAWEQVKDPELGFTVAMPPGAALDPASKRRTWKAEEGGISYQVAEIEAPPGRLDNQAYVRTVVAYVGGRCQRGLKLRGDLEVKGTTVVQYQSVCPDKTEWHGMLHFWNGKAVSTAYHAPAGVRGVEEPFFYSFLIAR
jgi:hypothetical protein